jgi:hypothetical protein
LAESDWEDAATYLEYLGVKSDLNSTERSLVLGAVHALKEHIVRTRQFSDASTATDRKFSPKELLGEAERVLLRASSGLSLLERLRRDSKLRDDFSKLLYQMSSDPESSKDQLQSKNNKR